MIYYCDSECFYHYWVWIWTSEDGQKGYFEDPVELIKWLDDKTKDDILVTKNGLGYDWPMVFYARKYNPDEHGQFSIYMRERSDWIIKKTGEYKRKSAARVREIIAKYWRFQDCDVQEIHNMFANLKRAACAMGYPIMRESGIHFQSKEEFTPEMKEEVKMYGWEDCEATRHLYKLPITKTEIESRKIFQQVTGVDVTSLGRPRAMTKILKEKFEEATGRGIWEAKNDLFVEPQRYHFGKILKDVGKPSYFKFDSDGLKKFQKVVMRYSRYAWEGSHRGTAVDKMHYDEDGNLRDYTEVFKLLDGKKLDFRVEIAGKVYRFKEGGLHSEYDDRPRLISDERNQLYDIDFSAYYPGLLMRFHIFCQWMMDAGFDVHEFFAWFYNANISEKAKPDGNKKLREVYKIICNLFYGKYGEKTDPLGDTQLQLKTCLTGQLAILRMIERMEDGGMECVYANTDGIVVSCPRGLKDRMDRILNEISNALNIGIEPVPINAMFLDNCNSYLWEMGNGYVKGKKEYTNHMSIANPTLVHPIVVTAVQRYLIEGIPVEDTINGCSDLRQFLEIKSSSSANKHVTYHGDDLKNDRTVVAAKVGAIESEDNGDRDYELEMILDNDPWMVARFQKHNKNVMYYHSTDGQTIYTMVHSGKTTGQIRKQPNADRCTMITDVRDYDGIIPENLDLAYYIKKAKDMIGDWEPIPRIATDLDKLFEKNVA